MNLFTKKSKEIQPKEEDVPGELPPLGGAGGDSAKPGEGVPDELPNLDMASAQPAPVSIPAKQEPSKEEPSIPDALPDIPTNTEKRAPGPSKRYSQEGEDNIPSFFSAAIKAGLPAGGDMLSAMKKYWDRRKLQEIPQRSSIVNETEIAIEDKVSKLKSLEMAWLAKMQDLNVLKQNLAYLEAEITSNSEELATLLKSRGRTTKQQPGPVISKKRAMPKNSSGSAAKAPSKKRRR